MSKPCWSVLILSVAASSCDSSVVDSRHGGNSTSGQATTSDSTSATTSATTSSSTSTSSSTTSTTSCVEQGCPEGEVCSFNPDSGCDALPTCVKSDKYPCPSGNPPYGSACSCDAVPKAVPLDCGTHMTDVPSTYNEVCGPL